MLLLGQKHILSLRFEIEQTSVYYYYNNNNSLASYVLRFHAD